MLAKVDETPVHAPASDGTHSMCSIHDRGAESLCRGDPPLCFQHLGRESIVHRRTCYHPAAFGIRCTAHVRRREQSQAEVARSAAVRDRIPAKAHNWLGLGSTFGEGGEVPPAEQARAPCSFEARHPAVDAFDELLELWSKVGLQSPHRIVHGALVGFGVEASVRVRGCCIRVCPGGSCSLYSSGKGARAYQIPDCPRCAFGLCICRGANGSY
mmetsp:Transcript_8829/g.25683  ORF Transcript_8829/g.25683 Transcript_8829/m.25683 type:complete len:213 (-) Transcript_8829:396-1034(-)